MNHMLPYREAKEDPEEKHICPLSLDTIARCVQLYSNPQDTVLTPFMGVGSEIYQSVRMGRRGVGCELKPSYYRQAVSNLFNILPESDNDDLFGDVQEDTDVIEDSEELI